MWARTTHTAAMSGDRDGGVAVVAVVDAAHPGDTAPLEAWLTANPTAAIQCVLGKTEGNGCVNDFTRGYATLAVTRALERTGHIGTPGGKQPPAIIMSGGTEGTAPAPQPPVPPPNERSESNP
jgi:hypothetical protein